MIDCKYSRFNIVLMQGKGSKGTTNSRLNKPASNLCEIDYRVM